MDGILSNPRRRLLFNNENLKTLRTILCTSPTVAETECLAWAHKVSLEQNGAPVGQPIQDDGEEATHGPEASNSWSFAVRSGQFASTPRQSSEIMEVSLSLYLFTLINR